MKLALGCLGLVVTVSLAGALSASPVNAEPPGAAATATAHALDEFRNCLAQRKCSTPEPPPSVTPTPSPPATPTPAPTATETPAGDTPAPTATPLPGIPAPAADGDPLLGYTRPVAGTDRWIELALPQGRWALYQAEDCGPHVDIWSPVELTTQSSGEVDVTSAYASCGVVAASWLAGAPCATDDDGACDLARDSTYEAWLGAQAADNATDTRAAQSEVSALTPTDDQSVDVTITPTSEPPEQTLTPTAQPDVPLPPARAQVLSQPAPPAPPRVVVQTVVVVMVVTAVPGDISPTTLTPQANALSRLVAAQPPATPTAEVVVAPFLPTPAPTPTSVLISTPAPFVVAEASTAVPTPAAAAAPPAEQPPGSWNWPLTFVVLAVIAAAGVGGFLYVRWRRRWTW